MDVHDPSYFGTVTFGEPETVDIPSWRDPQQQCTVTRAAGHWHPPERLATFLPEGFSIPLNCYVGQNGLRRFVPACSLDELIELAAVGGLAVIQGTQSIDAQTRRSYRHMKVIFDFVHGRACRGEHGMKEHLKRAFKYARDLFIRLTGRSSSSDRNVLPNTIGHAANGEGHCWSVKELIDRGRQAAREAGYQNPTNQHAISFGLLEAARLNPLIAEPEKVRDLIRLALFDIDPSRGEPDEKLLEAVTDRLLTAINRHLDDSAEDFGRWLFMSEGSVVKQIAKQKKQPGGRLQREDVRRALLHLCWQAYEYVGQCIHALMRTIKNSLGDLTEEERLLFEHMLEAQPYYGDLPLALLAERMDFLRNAILAIWDDPQNNDHVPVLHRLLAYYADMAPARRRADKRFKKICSVARAEPHFVPVDGDCSPVTTDLMDAHDVSDKTIVPMEYNNLDTDILDAIQAKFIDNFHSPGAQPGDRFSELHEHVRKLAGIECDQGCTDWDAEFCDDKNDCVTFTFSCKCDRPPKLHRMTLAEFKKLAEKFGLDNEE